MGYCPPPYHIWKDTKKLAEWVHKKSRERAVMIAISLGVFAVACVVLGVLSLFGVGR